MGLCCTHSVLFCAARVIPFATPLSHLQHRSALALNTPQLFSSSPSHVVTFLGCQLGRREGFPWIWAPHLGMCFCCDALADGEQGIPPYCAFLFLYPVGMSCSLCLCLTLVEMRAAPRVLEERQDSWVPQSPNTNCPGNEGNGVCAAAFPKLSWQFR